MKKKKILCIALIIIIIVALVFIFVEINKQKNASNNETVTNSDEKKIELNKECEIDTLTYVNIDGTSDYFAITDDAKWDAPDYGEGVTVSYGVNVSYDFIIDGKEYMGTYTLGDQARVLKEDGNPKYKLEIKNLTDDGRVTILIKEK